MDNSSIQAGAKYNRWTINKIVTGKLTKKVRCEATCECGRNLNRDLQSILTGMSKSCGCYRSEWTINYYTKHGRAKTPEYIAWNAMRARCRNPNASNYKWYGARGVTVCERWDTFENFFADMGTKPFSSFSIDRIDPYGNYEPSNCRWADIETQRRNKRSRAKS